MFGFSDLKVLVIGDICLNIDEYGNSTRTAPESDDAPILLNTSVKYSLGMAGNVASNLKSLGADVSILSRIALDYYGSIILNLLNDNGINYKVKEYLSSNTNAPTTVKNRIFNKGEQILRIDTESKNFKNKHFYNAISKLDYEDNYFDLVIISDYNKGLIDNKTIDFFKPELNRINKGEFFVDTKSTNINMFNNMILFPNSNELKNIKKHNNINNTYDLLEKLNSPFLIETMDKNGASIYYNSNDYYNVPSLNKNPIDVFGCGDTFISAFSLYYTKYKDKIKALEFANACSSAKAGIRNTVLYKDVLINIKNSFIKGGWYNC